MQRLEHDHSADALTPGGISWLRTHAVPVRRLVTQVVKKLLALSSWWPYAIEPGSILTSTDLSPVEVRDNTVLGYHSYTVTWPGVASLLIDNPGTHGLGDHDAQATSSGNADLVADPNTGSADVLAVSWSSRHAQTLLPVLENLAERGITSLVVDLATEADHRRDRRPAQHGDQRRCRCRPYAPGCPRCHSSARWPAHSGGDPRQPGRRRRGHAGRPGCCPSDAELAAHGRPRRGDREATGLPQSDDRQPQERG
jgi:hypothetical protein